MKVKKISEKASTSTSKHQRRKWRDTSGSGRRKRVLDAARSGYWTDERYDALIRRARDWLASLRSETSASEFHPFAGRKLLKGVPLPGVDGIQFAGIGKGSTDRRHVGLIVGEAAHRQLLYLSAGELASEPAGVFRKIANAGGRTLTQASKNALTKAIEAKLAEEPTFYVAEQPGWQLGYKIFVLPYGVIGDAGQDIVFAPSSKSDGFYPKFRVVGSSRRWRRRVGTLLRGNSLAMTATAFSLLSPLLALLGEENFMLVLVGAPGSGKTTIIVVATSQLGAHTDPSRAMALGAAETAKHTLNNLDNLMLAHTHLGLALDDLRGLRAHGSRAAAYDEVAFSLGDGSERGRANVDGQKHSRSCVLTSANRSLQQEAVGGGYEADRAALDRFVECSSPQPSIAFEQLHGAVSLDDFARRIKTAALENAGAVGLDFVRFLHNWVQRDQADCVSWLRDRVDWFIKHFAVLDATERVLRRFALIYAAGCLAIHFGLHPWSEQELADAVSTSLKAHLDLTVANAPGSFASADDTTKRLLALLRDWFVKKRPEMLQAGPDIGLIEGSAAARDCPAFLYQHQTRGSEVLLREGAFANLVRPVCHPDEAKRLLDEAGLIAIDKNRSRRSFSVKRTLGVTGEGEKWRPTMIALSRLDLDPALASHARHETAD